MKLRRLSTRDARFDAKLAALTRYDAAQDPKVQKTVRSILADVRRRGDAAVRAYTRKFDGVSPRDFSLENRLAAIPREQSDALRAAHSRIKAFHQKQLQQSWEFTEADGTRLGQRVTPLARVGLYVPGGKAAYPSSVLMNAVPAKVAGVDELVMVSPNPNALVLAAAALAGVDRVIGIGGAQAIGALVQPHAPAALRQRAGRGQPCETAADDFRLASHLIQNTPTCSTSASPSSPRGNPAASPTGKPAPGRRWCCCTASARARRAG